MRGLGFDSKRYEFFFSFGGDVSPLDSPVIALTGGVPFAFPCYCSYRRFLLCTSLSFLLLEVSALYSPAIAPTGGFSFVFPCHCSHWRFLLCIPLSLILLEVSVAPLYSPDISPSGGFTFTFPCHCSYLRFPYARHVVVSYILKPRWCKHTGISFYLTRLPPNRCFNGHG